MALREIKILRQLNHPNVIKLIEVVTSRELEDRSKGSTILVFEYCEHDLLGKYKKNCPFNILIIFLYIKLGLILNKVTLDN